MKKIRYIPYGYTMRNGRTVIAQDEAAVIREIFSAYINGASLQSIAELLTERKIPYSERTDVWDKARIARIIGNAKYIGDGEYDPIIEEEQYEEAAACRENSPPAEHLRKKSGGDRPASGSGPMCGVRSPYAAKGEQQAPDSRELGLHRS